MWGREVHVADATRTFAKAPVEENRPLSMFSNRWSTMPIRALPGYRMPRPDDRAWLDRSPGSDVPVIRQPFDPSDDIPFWGMGGFDGDVLYDREEAAGGEFRNQAGGDADKEMTDLLVEALRSIEAPDEQLVRLGVAERWARHEPPMEVLKLESTDGFIAFDLGDAPAVGIVRQAPKVLRDGAELLARSTTYAAASFGLQIGGGSAGLNAKPDDRDAALAAFLEEVAPLVESGRWLPGPGVGIQADDLSGLARADERAVAFDQTVGGRERGGRRPRCARLARRQARRHRRRRPDHRGGRRVGRPPTAARPQPQAGFDVECDALLVAGKAGVLEHDLAATVRAKVVVPLTPVPVTARALAVLGRAGVVVVPDFLSTAAPLLAARRPGRWRRHDPCARVGGRARRRGHQPLDGRRRPRPRPTCAPGRTSSPSAAR